MSAPLVLGNDLADKVTMDAVWPILSNREALAINEAWVGDAGVLLKQSAANVSMANCSWFDGDGCEHPSWMVWKKQLDASSVALLLMNNAEAAQDVALTWRTDLPPGAHHIACPCAVRDVHAHRDLGVHADGFTAAGLGAHDSAFLVVTSAGGGAEAGGGGAGAGVEEAS